ncbi:MAG: glycosyltransferase [Myxococcales bacterium]
MMRTTVVLPTHSGGPLLVESVRSVLSQQADFVLHVIDDGHNPSTRAEIAALEDPRIRYTLLPGSSLFRKLNHGFEVATDPWVKLWSDDDVMLPGCLARFAERAAASPELGLLYCDFREIDRTGAELPRNPVRARRAAQIPEICSGKLAALIFWCFGCTPGNIATVMLRRDAWKSTGGFREALQMAGDFDQWARVVEHYAVGFLREELVAVRAHPGQLSKNVEMLPANVADTVEVVQHLEKLLAPVVSRREADHLWIRERGRHFFHCAVRAAVRGRPEVFGRCLQALRNHGPVWPSALWWLVTANGRLRGTPLEDVFAAKRAELT